MDTTPQSLPPGVAPSDTKAPLMGPLQVLFLGLAASVAIGVTVTRKRSSERVQNDMEDSPDGGLELGMFPRRAGIPAMMAMADGADGKDAKRTASPAMQVAAPAKPIEVPALEKKHTQALIYSPDDKEP